jgi:hypothetical protein
MNSGRGYKVKISFLAYKNSKNSTAVLRKVKERVSKYVPSFKTPKSSPYTGDKLTEIEKISYLSVQNNIQGRYQASFPFLSV